MPLAFLSSCFFPDKRRKSFGIPPRLKLNRKTDSGQDSTWAEVYWTSQELNVKIGTTKITLYSNTDLGLVVAMIMQEYREFMSRERVYITNGYSLSNITRIYTGDATDLEEDIGYQLEINRQILGINYKENKTKTV